VSDTPNTPENHENPPAPQATAGAGRFLRYLDALDPKLFGPLAIMLALAPFVPEPHLLEKIKMLFAGTLHRPIDIFDLFLHGTPITILMLKFARMIQLKTRT
jgi:hypothetical protein